jgi:subtilase family serine protease
MSRHQIADITRSIYYCDKVLDILTKYPEIKVTEVSGYGDHITAQATIGIWEKMFNTVFYKFHIYSSLPSARQPQEIIRALDYTMPEEFEEYVEMVFNTVQFPPRVAVTSALKHELRKALRNRDEDESENLHGDRERVQSKMDVESATSLYEGMITPLVLNDYYGISSNKGRADLSQAVYATGGQQFSPADLNTWQRYFGMTPNDVSVVVGGHNSSSACLDDAVPCSEANSNVQYLMGISQVTPTWFWYDSNNDIRRWIIRVSALSNPPKVISISYGSFESDLISAVGSYLSTYVTSFDRAALILALQGVTILSASGDDGAPGKISIVLLNNVPPWRYSCILIV